MVDILSLKLEIEISHAFDVPLGLFDDFNEPFENAKRL